MTCIKPKNAAPATFFESAEPLHPARVKGRSNRPHLPPFAAPAALTCSSDKQRGPRASSVFVGNARFHAVWQRLRETPSAERFGLPRVRLGKIM